ncbi:MAG: stage III sporulation protein AE [Lachnospiraceae bacterium]|uniref:stage III sporulation protein AE n=1 Tax=Roseburia hominis TaxID=301301 RepID=UPI001F462E0E|nr:stage III sporulation protein AE [Roseburia hominis]MDY4838919.1 stage III sporulation protein AE [Lachnospiraceae bacterium]
MKRCIGICLILFLCLIKCQTYDASEIGNDWSDTKKEQMEEEMETDMLEQIGIEEIDDFMEDTEGVSEISFTELVNSLIKGEGTYQVKDMGEWLKNALCAEFRENKALLIQILIIGIAFGVLKNFTGLFENSYISELCFVMVYCVLVILLMKSFLIMDNLAKETLKTTVEFMQTLVPVYCMSMIFSNGATTAAGFYEVTFLIISLVQWIILYVLVPLVQVMILFVFLNEVVEGERFSKMTELLEDGIRFVLKFVTGTVVGLNVVQGLIQPAADRVKGSMFAKTASAIPGIGNSVQAVSEIIVGAGTLIKNSVGVAAMIIVLGITLLPVIKMGVLVFFYKFSAAVIEPVADKRISGTLNGVCRGSVLLAKIMLTSMLLFLITIAMVAASSSFVY